MNILNLSKPKIIGLIVVIMAVSLSGFTTHVEKEKNKKMGNYFWFRLDPVSGMPLTSSTLIYQGGDPYWCTFLGLGTYCSGAFTGYTQDVYGYHAAGYLVSQHYYVL